MRQHSGHASAWGILEGGWVSGLIAGLGMLIACMARSASVGDGFFMFPKLVAAPVFGHDTIDTGLRGILVGSAMYLVFASLLGIGFAATRPWRRIGKLYNSVGDRAVAAGVLYAITVWLGMTKFVLPKLNPTMSLYVDEHPVSWFALHILFGALLVATPILRRRYALRHATSTEEIREEQNVA